MPKKNLPNKDTGLLHRYAWDKIFILIILGALVIGYPGQNIYTLAFAEAPVLGVHPVPLVIADPAPYPINKSGYFPGTEFTGKGIVIVDVDSGVFLYKRNEDQLLSPASTTKILTALVALDHYNLDDVVTVDTVVKTGQVMGLVPGEKITVENLLYGALIHSGNDAAYALAQYYPGGLEKFVTAMNEKAIALHLEKSSFTNPAGFDNPNHKMTALDLARLASFALTNKTIAKMVSIPQITISDVTHTYFHALTNVNQLLGKIPGVGGIKTGWTEESGENLVTLVERNGHRVVIVLLKSVDRFGETARLIDWVFANYEWRIYKPS